MDLQADFLSDKEHFDFSGYPTGHLYQSDENKKVISKFKDELERKHLDEFAFLSIEY